MDRLTPTARLTQEALRTGPGNVHELCERTGRSRSATDKALAELAKANLIVKVDNGGDPADGAPTRWELADPTPADDESTPPGPAAPDATRTPADRPETSDVATAGMTTEEPAVSGEPEVDAAPVEGATFDPSGQDASGDPDDPGDPGDPGDPDDGAEGAEPDGASPAPEGRPTGATAAGDALAVDEHRPDDQPTPDGDTAGEQPVEVEQPKTCRGCQGQMPKICPTCWQKTPSYCGDCRKDMPQVRRGEPGEPVLLSNGLPKLRPGELEALVQQVLHEQPMPNHLGVTGWTNGRVAVFLPGRSPGAITNALRKLANTGVAELIGDHPERYRPNRPAESDTGSTDDTDSGQSPAGPPADDAAEGATAPAGAIE